MRVKITLADSGMHPDSLMALAPMLVMLPEGYSEKIPPAITIRRLQRDGAQVAERWDERKHDGEITMLVNKRFVASVEGSHVDSLDSLRTILDQIRHHRSQKRDVRREQSLEQLLQTAAHDLDQMLAGGLTSPTTAAANREFAVVVADALATLPDYYRSVIVWHQFERHSFVDIGRRMGRSPAAVRMLWVRGLEKLRQVFEETP